MNKWHEPHFAFVREVAQDYLGGACEALDYQSEGGWVGLQLANDGFESSFVGCKGLRRKANVYELGKAPRHPLAVCFEPLDLDMLTTSADFVVFSFDSRRCDIDVTVEQVNEKFTVLKYKIFNHYVHLFAVMGLPQVNQEDTNG